MPTPDDLPDALAPDDSDPFEGLVLDENFVRAAKQKESSARARMLADKWKKEPPGDTSFRPAPDPGRRRFRRTPKPGTYVVPRRKSSPNWQAPLFVLMAIVLVLVGMNPGAVSAWARQQFGGKPAGPAVDAQPSLQAPETARPTAPPTVGADPGVATLAHPFTGSPALSWPEGAKAIVVPAGHQVGVFGAATVSSYLDRAKAFLVATNLDPALLGGGYPTAALAMIDPKEKELLSSLRTQLAHPSADGDGTALFTRFNPDQALIDGDVVKVQGELTYASDGHDGLLIHADFTFVYPLRPGPHPDVTVPDSGPSSAAPVSWRLDGTSTDVARSIVRRILDIDVPDGVHFMHTPNTLWIQKWSPDIGNTACGVYNGYLNPQFPDAAAQGNGGEPSASGPASDPYDRSKLPAKQQPGTCGHLART